jgi:hypothetical protein
MQLRKAQRHLSRIKMALQGPSGCGKTFSSLLIAKGLTGDYSKVAVIDTENGSADLYAHLGDYQVLTMHEPFSPEDYIKAMEQCEMAGAEVIILDSITHCWDFLLDFHSSMAGNSFTNWSKVTPRHKAFIHKILQSPAHIIATMRVKQDYVLNEKNGKQVPEKVGLKAVQRDGMDYEFTLVFDLDSSHYATCSKDRTGLFVNLPNFKIAEKTGIQILQWLQRNSSEQGDSVEQLIQGCCTITELLDLYATTIGYRPDLAPLFTQRRQEIQTNHEPKFSSNGKSTSPH